MTAVTAAPSGSKLGSVTRVTVQLQFAGGGSAVYQYDGHCDSIYLTRGSRETFLYPRYQALFGGSFTQTVRGILGEGL
jgi:hypothetical protein